VAPTNIPRIPPAARPPLHSLDELATFLTKTILSLEVDEEET
jgi:hypothetical protein